MAKKERIVDDLQRLTDRISTQVRTVAIGILAISWGVIVGQPQIVGSDSESLRKHLAFIGLVALAVMICDFLQYLFGYLSTKKVLLKMEKEKADEAKYDYAAPTYRLAYFFFWFKQVSLLIACAWLFIAIVYFCTKAILGWPS